MRSAARLKKLHLRKVPYHQNGLWHYFLVAEQLNNSSMSAGNWKQSLFDDNRSLEHFGLFLRSSASVNLNKLKRQQLLLLYYYF